MNNNNYWNPKVIADNEKFLAAVKPDFSNKSKAMIMKKWFKNYMKVLVVLNKYFIFLAKSLTNKKMYAEEAFKVFENIYELN